MSRRKLDFLNNAVIIDANSILDHGKAHFENALKPAIFKISFSMFRIGIGMKRSNSIITQWFFAKGKKVFLTTK